MTKELIISSSTLNFDGYHIVELHIGPNPNFVADGVMVLGVGMHPQLTVPISGTVLSNSVLVGVGSHQEDVRKFRIELKLDNTQSISENTVPYQFAMHLIGYFTLGAEEDPNQPDWAIRSGISMLYGAARELLLMTTGRGQFPGVLLPSIEISFQASDIKGDLNATKALDVKKSKKSVRKKVAKKKHS